MVREIKFEQLDDVLQQADSLIAFDYKAAMKILGDVFIAITPPQSLDPFGAQYSDWVMNLYRRVAAVDRYEPAVDEADNNVDAELPLPNYFPFSTGDLAFIGRYLTGVGMILTELNLKPGSRVVEYGVGWGHVSAALARAGHDVTCVDIEAKFLGLAVRQAASMGCHIHTHHGAFGERPYPAGAPGADAVVFFEAFHHAFEHLDVLRRLRHNVLRPGGVLVLAAEPVHPAFPVPWGVRPDGHALWAVRRNRWMELGFQEDYLLQALLREGFLVSRTRVDELGSFGLLYRARLHEGRVRLGETLLPAAQAASWAAPVADGDAPAFAQAFSRATLDHDPGWNSVAVTLANYLTVPLAMRMDAGGVGPAMNRVFAPGERAVISVPLPANGRELRVWSETGVPAQLGMNNDWRALGMAVEELVYHAG